MIRQILIGVTLLTASTGARLEVLPANDGNAAWTLVGNTTGPRGTQHLDEQLRLHARGASGFDAVLAGPAGAKESFALELTDGQLRKEGHAEPRARDGSEATSDDSARRVAAALSAMNVLLATTREVPEVILPGASWTASADAGMPSGEPAPIPLHVVVRRIQGSDVVVSASGHGDATFRGRGQSVNVKITVDLEEAFHDGRLVQARESRTMAARVFFRSMTMVQTWLLNAVPA